MAQRELAEFSNSQEQMVIRTVDTALQEAETASIPTAAPRALPEPEPSSASPSEAPTLNNLSDVMVAAVQQVSPAVVTVINRDAGVSGSGSGVVVSEAGYIITNHHVVEGADTLSVLFSDGTRQEAQFIGSDPLSDIAVIQVPDDVPAVAVVGNSGALQPGEQVLAIGSPLGDLRNTVTAGVVSALNRSVANLEGLIQTDASINRGNSGGPLINMRGEVIGINTLVVRGDSMFGDQAEGLGFAVPSEIFSIVGERLIQSGEMVYPYMGVSYAVIDGDLAAMEDLPVQRGAFIRAVQEDTAAEEAGLQAGDIILAVDNTQLNQSNSLRYVLTQYQPGDTIDLTVLRGDEELNLSLTLGERPPMEEMEPPILREP
jgi:2-alkenal reductase